MLSRASLVDARPEIPEEESKLRIHTFISQLLSKCRQVETSERRDWKWYNGTTMQGIVDDSFLEGDRILVPSRLRNAWRWFTLRALRYCEACLEVQNKLQRESSESWYACCAEGQSWNRSIWLEFKQYVIVRDCTTSFLWQSKDPLNCNSCINS